MPRIFISYSRVDNMDGGVKYFVERLRKARPGDVVWWDEELRGGDVWWREILSQIDQCDIFIYLLSNESVNSPYCQAEYFEAQRLQKLILTVQVRGRTEIPEELSEIQYVDMTPVDKTDAFIALFAALAKLTDIIPRRRPHPLSPTPIPRPKKIPTVEQEKASVPQSEYNALPHLPKGISFSESTSKSSFINSWFVRIALLIIAIVVIMVIIIAGRPPEVTSVDRARTSTAIAQIAIIETDFAFQTGVAQTATATLWTNTPTATFTPSNTPTPTYSDFYSKQYAHPNATPRLSGRCENRIQWSVEGSHTILQRCRYGACPSRLFRYGQQRW